MRLKFTWLIYCVEKNKYVTLLKKIFHWHNYCQYLVRIIKWDQKQIEA